MLNKFGRELDILIEGVEESKEEKPAKKVTKKVKVDRAYYFNKGLKRNKPKTKILVMHR